MGLVINLKADTGLVDRSENTTRFYNDIKDYPTFTREEEIAWFNQLRHGATKEERDWARTYIMICNQRMVVAAAKKWASTDTLMDYVNEANFGLSEAIESFDATVGTKFASYAMWYILRAINVYNNGDNQLVRKTNQSKTFHVISKATNDFLQEFERTPTPEELLEIINGKYKKDIIDKNDLIPTHYASIDLGEANEDENFIGGDMVDYNRASASYNDYVEKENNDFDKKLVSSLLNKLSPRKKEIIKMRFGLFDDNGLNREYEREEIGQKLGLTAERVRQLEAEAMDEMKKEYIYRMGKFI
jgi:RNA polymerase primary sigma factor